MAYPFGQGPLSNELGGDTNSHLNLHWSGEALGRRAKRTRRSMAPGAPTARAANLDIEALEPRFLLSADLLPVSVDLDPLGSDLVLQFDPGEGIDPSVLKLLDAENDMAVVATIDPAQVGDIELVSGDGDTKLTVDVIMPFPFDNAIHFDAGGGNDVLAGPSADTTWNVTGVDEGSVAGISFSGVETLQGAAGNQDTFVLAEGGSLSGVADGGAGGFDVVEAQGSTLTSKPTGPQSGTVTVDGVATEYAGLEPIVLSGSNIVLDGTDVPDVFGLPVGDNIVLETDPSGSGALVFRPATPTSIPFEATFFNADAASITINLGAGADQLRVGDLGDFSGSLTINGEGTLLSDLDPLINSNPGATDTVIFSSDLSLAGNALTVDAEIITVEAGVSISTGTAGAAGNVLFTGEVIELLTGSALQGGDITLIADAESNALDLLVLEFIEADARISLEDASLIGENVTLTAHATSLIGDNPSALEELASKVFDFLPLTDLQSPVIFSDTTVTSTVEINGNSVISAAGDVTMTSDTDVISSITTLMLAADFPAGSAVFNMIDADASVGVGSGSEINADGSVALSAILDNDVTTLATGASKLFSIEYALVEVDAFAFAVVGSGATVSAGTSIDVLAQITNNLSTTAKPFEGTEGSRGADFALSFLNSQATAAIDGTATAGTTINVTATSETTDVVGAASDPANIISELQSIKDQFSNTTKESTRIPFDASTGLTIVENATGAEARIGDGATATAGGDVTVEASAVAKVQYTATSEVEDASFGLNAALAFGDVTIDAKAFVGEFATVTAGGNLVVEAAASAPKQDGLGQIFTFFEDKTLLDIFYDTVIALNDLETFIVGQLFTTYARSSVDTSSDDGEGGVGITASAVDFSIDTNVMAFVGAEATVTADDVLINAKSHIDTVNMTGVTDFEFVVVPNPVGGTDGAVTTGASLSFMDYDVDVYAFIDDGAMVTAQGRVDVTASSTENIFMLTESGGKGDSFALNGAGSTFNRSAKVIGFIDDMARVDAVGDVTIIAEDHTNALVLSGGVAKGANVGVGLSVAQIDITGATRAFIGDAEAQSDIFAGLSLFTPITGKVASDGSIRVEATSGGPLELSGGVPTPNPNQIEAYAVAGATGPDDTGDAAGGKQSGKGKFGLNVSGDIAINTIGGDTTAFLDSTAVLEPGLAVKVEAFSDSFMRAITGSAVYAGGGSSGIAGSYSQNTIDKTVRAFIDGASIADTTGFAVLDVTAETQGSIFAISAGGTSAGKLGVAGSVSNNTLTGKTEAFIDGVTLDRANIRIEAADGFDLDNAVSFDGDLSDNEGRGIFSVAGAVTLGGKAGIGAGVAINEISSETRAYADDLNIGSLNSVSVLAVTDNEIESYAAALSAGASNALAGAVTYNTIENKTQAMIIGSTLGMIAPALNGISVVAVDASKIRTGAGGIGVSSGGTIGFGASATYNKLASTVEAKIENAQVQSDADVVVSAEASREIETVAVAGSGGGTAGVAGAIVINDLDNTVRAHVTGGAVLSAGNIDIAATQTSDLTAFAFGGSQGSTGAVAGGVVWNTSDNIAEAFADGATVDALAQLPARSVAVLDVGQGPAAELLTGVSITALNAALVTSTSANVGAAGTVGAGLSGNTTIMRDQSRAYVTGGAEINLAEGASAGQSTTVRAGNTVGMLSIGGGLGGSGTGGVGLANNTLIMRTDTDAYIDGASFVGALNDVDVAAAAVQTIDDIVAGGGAGGTAGIAGSVSVGVFASSVSATVGDATVIAGDALSVSADQSAELLQVAGSLGGAGTVGAGGSVAVSVVKNVTNAEIGSAATTDAAGETRVAATSTEAFDTIAATIGGGGTAGLGASVIVKVSEAETSALIAAGAQVNQTASAAGQSVLVEAADTVDMLSVAGALTGGGTAAVGASTDVQILRNKTLAEIGSDAAVSAVGDVSVVADAAQLVDSYVVSGAGGGTVGLAGAVSVLAIGSAVDQSLITDTGSGATTQGQVDQLLGGSETGSALGSSSNEDINGFTDASRNDGEAETGSLNVSSDVEASGAAALGNTDAIIGERAVVSAGALTVSADNALTLNSVPVGGGFAGAAGLAGAVGVTNVQSSAQALVSDDAKLGVSGDVDVLATTSEDMVTVSAAGAAGGTASLTGSVLVTTVDTTTQSRLGNNVQIGQDGAAIADNLNLSAVNTTTLTSVAGQIGVGGTVGLGGSSNTILFGKTTNALIGAGSDIDVLGDVSVTASTFDDIDAVTISGGGGGVVGLYLMSGVNVIENSTLASIQDSVVISAGNNVLVDAMHESDLVSVVGAASIGGTVGVGGGAGVSTFGSITAARIDSAEIEAIGAGNDARVDGRNISGLSVRAASSLDLTADTFAVAGGSIVGLGAAVTTNIMGVGTEASIGAGAFVSAPDIAVSAQNLSDVFGGAQSLGAGTVGVGGAVDTETFENAVSAGVAGAAISSSRGISIDAQNREILGTITGTISGGVAGLGGAVTVATLRSTTSALATDAVMDGAGDLDINALSDTTTNQLSGQVAGGVGAIGASVSTLVDSALTEAFVAASDLDLEGTVSVAADSARDFNTLALGGAGGVIAVNGAVSTIADDSATSAEVRANTTVDETAKLAVTANSLQSYAAETGIANVAVGAIGAAVTTVSSDAITIAEVDDLVAIGQSAAIGDMDVLATSNATAWVDGIALSGGVVSIDATVSSVTLNPWTTAQILSADINATGAVVVEAISAATGDVDLLSAAAALGAANAAVAVTNVAPTTQALVGAGSFINAGDLHILAHADVTATSNTASASLAIVSGEGSVALATADPTVSALLESGLGSDRSEVLLAGNLEIRASGNARADATSDASSFNFGGIGASVAIATMNGDVDASLATGALITAAGSASVRALMNVDPNTRLIAEGNKAKANAISASGGLIGGIAGSIATTNTSIDVDASVGDDAVIDAGMVLVEAHGFTDVENLSGAGASGLFVAASASLSNATIENETIATVGDRAKLNAASDLTVAARAITHGAVTALGGRGSESDDSAYKGTGVGLPTLIDGGGAIVTGSVNAIALVDVGDDGILTADNSVSLLARNLMNVDFRAAMDQGAFSFSDLNIVGGAVASSDMTIDGDAIVRVGDRTVIAADIVNIDAANEILATSKARAIGVGALGSFAFSNATLDGADTIEAKVDLGQFVDITADIAATLSAFNDGVDQALIAESFAKYDSFTVGLANAVVNGTLSVDATVTSGGDLDLSTNDLMVIADSVMALQRQADVEADGGLTKVVEVLERTVVRVVKTVCKWLPWPLDKLCETVVDTVVRWVKKLVEVVESSLTFTSQNGAGFSETAAINLNGTLSNFNTQPRFLTVGADGGIDPTSNIAARIEGGQIIVDDIISDVDPIMSFFAPDGSIVGDALINVNRTIPKIEIRNASELDLVIGGITMTSEADLGIVDFDLSFVSLVPGEEYEFAPNILESTLLIENTGDSDIIFSESFESVTAVMDIVNTGGDILTAPDNVTITVGDVGHIVFEAAGSVGTAADPFDLVLIRGQVMPDGQAGNMPAELVVAADTAHIGLTGVNTTQAAFDAAQKVDGITVAASTMGDFNLYLGDSFIRDINGIDWLADGTYTIVDVTSVSGDVTIEATNANATSVDFGLIPDWVGWQETNQLFIDSGAVGTISALGGTARIAVNGTITDRDGDPDTEIIANRIELSAASIGAAGNALEIDAVAAFEASATGNIFATDTAGTLNLDGVSGDLVGLVSLDGDILGVSSTSDLEANSAYLVAQGSIGSAVDPLETSVNVLDANALGGGINIVNNGALILADLASVDGISADGDIEISALSPITVSTDMAGVNIALTATQSAGDDFINVAEGVELAALANVDLEAGDAVSLFAQASVLAGGAVAISAGTNITLAEEAAITADVDVSLIAAQDIALGVSSSVEAGGLVALDAGRDLTVGAGAEISGTGGVALTAGASILLDDLSTINSDGAVTVSLTGGNGQPGSGGTIVLGGTINAGQIDILGTDGADTIAIRAVTEDTPMTVSGGLGDDLVRVGSNANETDNTGGDLTQIAALLTVDGGGQNDVLDLDSSGLGAGTGELTATLLTGLGMQSDIFYSGMATLNVTLGEEADDFTIRSTHSGQTFLSGGSGEDAIFVESIAGQTDIDGGDDDDSIFVGLKALPSVLDGIAAQLKVDGGGDADTLTLDDSGENANELGVLTASDVNGFGMAGAVLYEGVETLNVELGSGDDRVDIRSTLAETNLKTGAGGDLIYVSSGADLSQLEGYAGPLGDLAALHDVALHGTLDGIVGALDIDAGSGSNTLSVSDRDDVDPDGSVLLTSNAITGLAPVRIDYAATGGDFSGQGFWSQAINVGLFGRGVNIYAGTSNDAVLIDSVATGGVAQAFGQVVTTLFLGAGQDTAVADLDTGHLVVRGEGGDDSLDGTSSSVDLLLFGDADSDELIGGSGSDLLFGDSGRATYLAPTGFDVTFGGAPVSDHSGGGRDADFDSLDVVKTVGGLGDGADVIRGLSGDDVLLGGGGSDAIDGGENRDLIFGDGATLLRTDGIDDNLDPRFRSLTGAELYSNGLNDVSEGEPLVAAAANLDAEGNADWSDWTIDAQNSANDGDDTLAGGAASDKVFGGQGDDSIRGDGALDAAGMLVASTGAGDDYVEGNGGSDSIWGDLGQDDLIGGSSALYGLEAAERADGSDVIFGGTGDAAARDDAGDTSNGGHATDADMILGDNGNIFRIGTAGPSGFALAEFAYDQSSPFEDRGDERIVVRAAELLDYTPGGVENDALASGDLGAGDELHGEAGDDTVYGMTGSDELFGEGQDDDLIGGRGHDVIYGGTGNDGVIGDDGRIFTSRIGTAEPLYGIEAITELDVNISISGNRLSATLNEEGALKKSVDLTPFDPLREVVPGETLDIPIEGDDVIFGGLGDDSLHGSHGDDAISGAEAGALVYGNLVNPGNLLVFGAEGAEVFDPLARIDGLFLNPDDTAPDGEDVLFGDIGNDWLFGGTESDTLYGGFGDDLLDGDDDKSTLNGANTRTDNNPDYADILQGGAGRDILIANNRGDRLSDWAGQFNDFNAPKSIANGKTFLRAPAPAIFQFFYDLSESNGADQTRVLSGGDPARNGEPFGELGIVTPADGALWQEQTGGPEDPLFGDDAAMVAAQTAGSGVQASELSQDDANSLFDEAVARFATHSGMSLDMSGVELRIADLDGDTLARTMDGVIWIDPTAAGHGWFVDATPETDEEFAALPDGTLRATDDDATNRIDLLSVLMHEIGHVAGLDHAEHDPLMSVSLATGLRLVPAVDTATNSASGSVYNDAVDGFVSTQDDAALKKMHKNGNAAKGKGKIHWEQDFAL